MSTPHPSSKPFVLVDGSSYLYRAFHAMPELKNSRGEPTGATYGVTNMLRRLLAEYEPAYVAVVFDAKGRTFRDDIYAEYKAHRPPMPDELVQQIESIHSIVNAMGLPLLMIDGVEADDVIGTLACQAAKAGMSTLISTGDKDLAQLVNDRITLVNTMNESLLDPTGVMEKFGVPPDRIVDYLSLVGDTSDNVPGVPGVGPKTAAKWIQQYGSLDAVVTHASDIKGKVGESLRASLDVLPMARKLVTIHCEVPLDVTPHELVRRKPNGEGLRELFRRLEFKSWLADLGGINVAVSPAPSAVTEVKTVDASLYETVLDESALDHWITRLKAAREFAFDTETTDLDAQRAEIVGVSFADKVGAGAYVPLAHQYPGAPVQLDRAHVLAKLKPLLEDEALGKIGQNAKYDMLVLQNYDIVLRGVRYDTMLESYVVDSTGSRHDMDSLALKYLGYKTVEYEEVTGKGKNQINFSEVPLETASTYAAEDADITLRLHEHLWPRLNGISSLAKLFREIEMPLVPVLARMESHGVCIDAAVLRIQSAELAKRMLELEQDAYQIAGQPFNIASPKQIQEILFDKLNIPVIRKTPTGQPSTAEDVLQELAHDYPLPNVILEHRGLSKLKSTYADKLPEMINPKSGRVHTSYHQAVAGTGRLSSSDPNLQNIPIRTAEGRRIRQAFIPAPGHKIVSADYSQIELRIMAHFSGDSGLIKAFAAQQDIHRATAAEVFGATLENVSDDQRRAAKAINFGLIYGMSAFGLARQLKIDRSAAQEYVNLYFRRYPGVKSFMDSTREQARANGFVETLFGRRLYLAEINASNAMRRQAAERAAINAPMQGTAADLIKLAMINVDAWLTTSGTPARMIMQVHDELVFEVAESAVETVCTEARTRMENVAKLKVPLIVDVGIGANWDEAH